MEEWYTQPIEHWYYFLLLIAVGFAVGFINTLAGGGSLLSLPTLIFLGLAPGSSQRDQSGGYSHSNRAGNRRI